MSRRDAIITVFCDGYGCQMRLARRESRSCINVDLFDLGLGDWSEGTVDESLRAEGWTSKDGKDYCPECGKDNSNAK